MIGTGLGENRRIAVAEPGLWRRHFVDSVHVVAGVDLGGTAVNYTFLDGHRHFLIEELCEHPARSREGPGQCLQQIADGLELAATAVGISRSQIVAVGLGTPGPATAEGVFAAAGSTNFAHPDWAGYDIRGGLEAKLGLPVSYLNDGNAAALWGHFSLFGESTTATSISAVIGTGLGGGVIVGGEAIVGRNGFGGELGHMLLPYRSIPGIDGLVPRCNCGRTGDLESLCSLTAIERSLLPFFLTRHPGHQLGELGDMRRAAKFVRGLAEKGDPMCREIFRVQAMALGLFIDAMINVFDPDALLVGGGALETEPAFQDWFLGEVRAGMPPQRVEQADIPIAVMPNGDTAGARGAAIRALSVAGAELMP
jgi:glucokinase